jgi:hypothetical protein
MLSEKPRQIYFEKVQVLVRINPYLLKYVRRLGYPRRNQEGVLNMTNEEAEKIIKQEDLRNLQLVQRAIL